MIVGFVLAAIRWLPTTPSRRSARFLSSNAHRPWWLLWTFAGGVLVAVFVYGYLARDGDLSYGRLAPISGMLVFEWWTLIPPLAILVLTRFGIPVSTTFLILIVFNPRGLESTSSNR